MTSPNSHYLPIIVRDGGITDWERKFCASLIARERRGLSFTDKQQSTLDRIVEAFRRRELGDEVTE